MNQQVMHLSGEIYTPMKINCSSSSMAQVLYELDNGQDGKSLISTVENEPTSFTFMSRDQYTNENKLLILINGSGAVRAGQRASR